MPRGLRASSNIEVCRIRAEIWNFLLILGINGEDATQTLIFCICMLGKGVTNISVARPQRPHQSMQTKQLDNDGGRNVRSNA